jgi:hypothetical protein
MQSAAQVGQYQIVDVISFSVVFMIAFLWFLLISQ